MIIKLEFFKVDPQTAEWIAGVIDSAANVAYSYVKKFLTQDKIQKFAYSALKFTLECARKLSLLIDDAIEKTKTFSRKVKDKVKSLGRDICDLFGWDVPDWLKEETNDKEESWDEEELRDKDESRDEEESVDEEESKDEEDVEKNK